MQKIYFDTIDIVRKIEELHAKNSYLLDDPKYLTGEINRIIQCITDYANMDIDTNDLNEFIINLNRLHTDIYNLRNNYLQVIRENIEKY